jgi:hypothetical protein
MSCELLVAERGIGFDFRGAPGGDVRGKQRNHLKMVLFAAIPRASVSAAMNVKPEELARTRRAQRMS